MITYSESISQWDYGRNFLPRIIQEFPGLVINRPFPSSVLPLFQTKRLALRLVLEQRHKRTRKWPALEDKRTRRNREREIERGKSLCLSSLWRVTQR